MIYAKWNKEDARFEFSLVDNGGSKITDKEHANLLSGQCEGMVIVPGEDGRPVLKIPSSDNSEQTQASINRAARAYLSETDWYVTRKQETGVEIPDEILNLRAEARARVVE